MQPVTLKFKSKTQVVHIDIHTQASTDTHTANQQIVAAIKFGISPYRLCSVRSTYDHVFWRDKY